MRGKKGTLVNQYEYKGYKVKVRCLNETSIEDFYKESVETSFIPKIMKELESNKSL